MARDKASRDTQGMLETLLELGPDLVWVSRAGDGRFLLVSAAACRRFGLARARLLGMRSADLLESRADRGRLAAFRDEARRRGWSSLTVAFKTKGGESLELELRGAPVKGSGGGSLLVIARPVAEEARERRQALALYQGFQRSNDVMFWCDAKARIVDVNEAFTRHYGYTSLEAMGKSPGILRSSQSTDQLYKNMWAAILDPKKGWWRGRIVNKAKDGREIPFILTISKVTDAKGAVVGYISNAMDISEQVALEGRLSHAEALAALGEMAAVVAHEIRNPLSSIVMAAQQLASEGLSAADRDMVVRVLRSEGARLNAALTNFLAFARPAQVHLQRGSLNALVEEVCALARSNGELLRGARLSLTVDKRLRAVPFDADQLRQVAWNILVNAAQALEGSGTIVVETGAEGRFAFLRVRDSGPGIPRDQLARVFKPFHTTKRQGTGLGLSVAERIVKAHGGRISVESRPGRGATFTIHLPLMEG